LSISDDEVSVLFLARRAQTDHFYEPLLLRRPFSHTPYQRSKRKRPKNHPLSVSKAVLMSWTSFVAVTAHLNMIMRFSPRQRRATTDALMDEISRMHFFATDTIFFTNLCMYVPNICSARGEFFKARTAAQI
jgi:hypothetical protein